MNEKDIKRLVVKQLKSDFPKWPQIPKKEKKALAKEIFEEVVRRYSLDKEVDMPMNELTGIPASPEDIRRSGINHSGSSCGYDDPRHDYCW